MEKKSLRRDTGKVAFLTLVFLLISANQAYASPIFIREEPILVTLTNTAVAFFALVLGVRIAYFTRGGFFSIAFILITIGIAISYIAHVGLKFLIDSSMLATVYDVAGVVQVVGGVIFVLGLAFLCRKLKG